MIRTRTTHAAAARHMRFRVARCVAISYSRVLLAILVAGVLACASLAKPIYHRYKEKTCVKRARVALQKSDYAGACLSARQALQLNSRNIAAWSILADIAQECRSPQTFPLRHELMQLEPNVEQHRIDLAGAAIAAGHPRLAQTVLGWIERAGVDNARMHHAAANLALVARDVVAAREHLSEALKEEPSDLLARFNLGVLQLASPDPAAHTAGRATLEAFRANADLKPEALRSLMGDALQRHDLARAAALSEELHTDGRTEYGDRVWRLAILYELTGPARCPDACSTGMAPLPCYPAALAALQREVKHDPERIYDVGHWMLEHRMTRQARAWLAGLEGAAALDPRVLLLIAECHFADGAWRELEEQVREERWGELEFERLALLSLALRQAAGEPSGKTIPGSAGQTSSGRKEEWDAEASRANWQKALRTASDNLTRLRLLAKRAASWNWGPETEEALWRIVEAFPGHDWAPRLLLRAYYIDGCTGRIRDLSTALARAHPGDWASKNNLALTSLLLRTNVDTAHALAGQVFWQQPPTAGCASTYAWSLHCRGRTVEGLEVLSGLSEVQLRQPSTAAYYGALLAAAGRTAEAAPYLAVAEAGKLLPEECEIVETARQRR